MERRRRVDDALERPRHRGRQRAELRSQAADQLGRECDARLTLERAPQLPWIVIDAEEHQLLHAVASKVDERAQRLRGQHGVDHERHRPVLLTQRQDRLRAGLRRSEVRIDNEHIHRLTTDDAVGVCPIQSHIEAM